MGLRRLICFTTVAVSLAMSVTHGFAQQPDDPGD